MRHFTRITLFCVFMISIRGAVLQAQTRVPLIINGEETEDFPAVGIVGELSTGGFCTGTLISPSHVLTAAHCAEYLLEQGAITTGTFEVNGRVYRTASVEIIPTYNSRTFSDDVAILVLDQPVEGVEPMVMSTSPPNVGELVTIVGFGGGGTPEEGSDGTFGVKRMGFATVDDVSETEFSWLYDDPSESNPAPGDSGGPVFIQRNGGYQISGIVSSGTQADAGLGDINFNARIDAYEIWITDTVLATQETLDVTDAPEVTEDPSDRRSRDGVAGGPRVRRRGTGGRRALCDG